MVQMAFDDVQAGRLHSPSGQPVPALSHLIQNFDTYFSHENNNSHGGSLEEEGAYNMQTGTVHSSGR